MKQSQRIISLQSENVKRLVAVEIIPGEEPMTVIGGRNGSGKTSVLDSICWALGGKKGIQGKPIREGETSAKTVIELDDIIVTRKYTDKGSTLIVTNKDGAKYTSAQAMLDKLVGDLSFDPLAFTRLKPEEKADLLRRLGGVDTTDLEIEKEDVYAKRRDVNRDHKSAEAAYRAMPHHEDLPDKPVSIDDLMAELEAVEKRNASLAQQREKMADRKRQLESLAEDYSRAEKSASQYDSMRSEAITNHERRIADLMRQIEEAKHSHAAQLEQIQRQEDKAKAAKDEAKKRLMTASKADKQAEEVRQPESTSELRDKIANAGRINEKVSENARRDQKRKEAEALAAESDRMTKRLEEIAKEIAKLFEAAKFPIEGLAVSIDGVVTYGGIPVDQCSAAEQLRISTAMGMAMNPGLRVIFMRDGSLMDDHSMAMVNEMAAKNGYQVFVERVCVDADDCTILIEDGQVAAIRGVRAKAAVKG